MRQAKLRIISIWYSTKCRGFR